MKQRRLIMIASALGAAASVLVIAAAGTARTNAQQTLAFTGVERHNTMANGAPNVGGEIIFDDVIYNRGSQFGKPSGARVGTAEGVCTVVTEMKAQCVITAHVPDGQIVVVGAIVASDTPHTDHYAIVGGGGAYGNAQGTVTTTPLGETRNLVVLHLAH